MSIETRNECARRAPLVAAALGHRSHRSHRASTRSIGRLALLALSALVVTPCAVFATNPVSNAAAEASAPASANAQPGSAKAAAEKVRAENRNFFAENADRLDLDASDLTEIERITVESRAISVALATDLREAQAQMKALLDAPDPSREAVMAQADTIGAIETRIKKHQIATLLDLRGLLSAQQRAAFERLHSELRDQRNAMRKAASFKPPSPSPANPESARVSDRVH